MNYKTFKTCVDCLNRQSSPTLGRGRYYCPFVKHIFTDGIVTFDIDAIECIRKGFFRHR